jgi:hypothetical protein
MAIIIDHPQALYIKYLAKFGISADLADFSLAFETALTHKLDVGPIFKQWEKTKTKISLESKVDLYRLFAKLTADNSPLIREERSEIKDVTLQQLKPDQDRIAKELLEIFRWDEKQRKLLRSTEYYYFVPAHELSFRLDKPLDKQKDPGLVIARYLRTLYFEKNIADVELEYYPAGTLGKIHDDYIPLLQSIRAWLQNHTEMPAQEQALISFLFEGKWRNGFPDFVAAMFLAHGLFYGIITLMNCYFWRTDDLDPTQTPPN